MQDDQLDKIIQRAAESLYEDESLRSNMTDDEASVVFDWAVSWVERQMRTQPVAVQIEQVKQQELGRVRTVIKSLNALAGKKESVTIADALTALQPTFQVQSLARDQVFRLITALTTVVWEMRDRKNRM